MNWLLASLRSESYRKGAQLSSAFNVVLKAMVFSQNLVVAYFFGANVRVDIYFYTYSVVALIAGYASNLNSTVLIPQSMQIRSERGVEESTRFLAFFFLVYATLTGITILALFADPIFFFRVFSKFDLNSIEQNKDVLLLSLPLILLMVQTNFLADILVSFKMFTVPAVVGIVNSIFVICFILGTHNFLEVRSILLGLNAGYLINLAVLVGVAKYHIHWSINPRRIKIELIHLKNIGYALVGNVTTTVGSYLPIYLLSGFQTGVITSLNFGQKMALLPDQLISSQVSQVAAIKLNELYSERSHAKVDNSFRSLCSALFFLMTPIAIVLFYYSETIVSLLLKRGAFTYDSVKLTSTFFRLFALTLPLMAVNTMIARVYMAGQRILDSLISQWIMIVVFLLSLFLTTKYIGPQGYPLTTLLYLSVSIFIYTPLVFRKIFPYVRLGSLFIQLLKITLFCGIMFLPFVFVDSFVSRNTLVKIVSIFLYLLTILASNYFMGIDTTVQTMERDFLTRLMRFA
jgi:putative peptidoglycan lipid II flippase